MNTVDGRECTLAKDLSGSLLMIIDGVRYGPGDTKVLVSPYHSSGSRELIDEWDAAVIRYHPGLGRCSCDR